MSRRHDFLLKLSRHGLGMAVLMAGLLAGCSKVAPPKGTMPSTKTGTVAPASNGVLEVNDIAASPEEHIGPLRFVAAVADINPGSGFVVVDRRVPGACTGSTCITGACGSSAHIPVRWNGPAPALQQVIEIQGRLEANANGGLSMIAEHVQALP